MDITFETVYKKEREVFQGHAINLGSGTWFDPWTMGLVCLKAIEFKKQPDKKIVCPQDRKILSYLRRMHFDSFLSKLTYASFLEPLTQIEINEKESNTVCEIEHCNFRDELDGRLSKIKRMFLHFGLGDDESSMATSLVGELGNNVFDHNDGQWPTDVRGAIILAQMNPLLRRIEVVVGDPGIGFRQSLAVLQSVPTDQDAIKLGLSGVTGRVGEPRGQGLRIVQNWTINNFDGMVRIHSGTGLVIVDEKGIRGETTFKIQGTLASFVVKLK